VRAILLFILVLSVIFNLLFSAGFVKARSDAKRLQHEHAAAGTGTAPDDVDGEGDGDIHRPAADGSDRDVRAGGRGPGRMGGGGGGLFPREVQLDPAQKEVFEQLRQSMREEEAVLDDTMADARNKLAEELNGEEPDIDRLRELIAQQASLMQQRRVSAANRFADFLHVLSPEQTRIMARHMLRNMPRPGERERGSDGGGRGTRGPEGETEGGRSKMGSPEVIQRFDADGDGSLNDVERSVAQAEFEKHRRDWEAKRAELRQRFDVDKNGDLDREESAAMRQWLLENRPRDRGRERRDDRDPHDDTHHDHPRDHPEPPPPGSPAPQAEPGGSNAGPFMPEWW